MNIASTVILFGIAACSGSNNDPGAGNDPGTGTQTLAIEGSVRAQPYLINARTGTDFETEFSVRVTLAGQPVTTGSVTITCSSGKIPLTYDNDGRWRGGAPQYDEVYTVDVVSGPDKAEGVRVDGPDIHTFSEPTQGAAVDGTVPLMVRWDRDDEADVAILRTENLDDLAIPDSGAYELVAGGLKVDPAEARQNTLRLTRSNRVVPAGAAAGSLWSVTIENEVDVAVRPAAL